MERARQTKVINDCYDMLHTIEMGKGSLQKLSRMFASDKGKPESNYRQVERIKKRCVDAGVWLEFDSILMKFRTERNAKLKFLDKMESLPRPPKRIRRIRQQAFGYYAEKILTPAPVDSEIFW